MRLAINAYEANVEKRVGSNLYAFRVLQEVYKRASDHEVVVFLPTLPVEDMPTERKGWTYQVLTPTFFWSQWRLPLGLYVSHVRQPFDVVFSLGHYAPRWTPCPSAVCIMDLAYLYYPQFYLQRDVYKLTAWTNYSVRKSSGVVAISQHTLNDLKKEFSLSKKESVVAYPGIEKHILLTAEQEQVYLAKRSLKKRKYLVYVGTIQPRKNIQRLLEAFEKVAEKNPELQLVLAGKVGWMADDVLAKLKTSTYQKRIQLLGFVSEAEKTSLLRHAAVSVQLGLYEGFGIPALESLQLGVPTVVANTASLPEVVGTIGWQVNPLDVDEIASTLIKVLALSEHDRSVYAERAKQQAQQFSWQACGEAVWQLLVDVASKKSRKDV